MEKKAEKVEIAVLGGVGFNLYSDFKLQTVKTPYGEVAAYQTTIKEKKLQLFPGMLEKITFLLTGLITEQISGQYMPLEQNA